jgi:hypothetical protein
MAMAAAATRVKANLKPGMLTEERGRRGQAPAIAKVRVLEWFSYKYGTEFMEPS